MCIRDRSTTITPIYIHWMPPVQEEDEEKEEEEKVGEEGTKNVAEQTLISLPSPPHTASNQ